jgi:hypothetical protein
MTSKSLGVSLLGLEPALLVNHTTIGGGLLVLGLLFWCWRRKQRQLRAQPDVGRLKDLDEDLIS